jgi:hypothetical protein
MQSTDKSSLTGIPKIIYDPTKHHSNIHEVGRKLNFYVQRTFTGLHDCISNRAVRPIIPPPEPGTTPASVPVQLSSQVGTQDLLSTTIPFAPRSSTSSTSSSASQRSATAIPSVSVRTPVSEMETFKYLEKYKLFLLAEEKRNIELSQLFGIVDELLSVTSKERVMAHENYADCLAARDGSALWNIVYTTVMFVGLNTALPSSFTGRLEERPQILIPNNIPNLPFIGLQGSRRESNPPPTGSKGNVDL